MTAHVNPATASHPPQPIRMVALDLDGTTLKNDKTIGPRTLEALKAAHAKGVEIALASGRMTPAMIKIAEKLGLDVCIVSYNGAVVCDRASKGRTRIHHTPLPSGIARELVAFARERNLQCNFYHEDIILSEDAPHLRPYIDLYHTRTTSPYRIVDSIDEHLHIDPTKVLFVMDAEKRAPLEAEMTPLFGHRCSIIRSDPEYLEFLHPTVNKGIGVERLCEVLNIPMAAVMGVGDNDNDIHMFEMVGWPVAVANASANAKAAATVVTVSDNEHDAVAEAIERWVL